MKIILNRELSRVHDAMDGLVLSYRGNYKSFYEEFGLKINKAPEEALHFICEKMKFDIPYSELLFSKETGTAIAFAHSRFIPSNLTIDSFVNYLRGLSVEEIKLIVLSDLKPEESNLSEEEMRRISQDESRILDFIRELKLSSTIKWEALEFFRDVKASMERFIDLVKEYIPIYKKLIKNNEKLIEDFEEYIAKGIETEGEAFFSKISRGSISLDAREIIACTLFFNSRSLICNTVEDKLYIFIGMDYEESVRLVTGEGEIDFNISIFKNLSDKTRFQILNLLKHRELYGQEIAEKIGITMATVSYHMSYLLASNLVKLEKVGQKGYYTLNKDTLDSSIDFLKKNFNL